MENFRTFFHLTPLTKAFVFVTSQRVNNDDEVELHCEYFLILTVGKQKEVKRMGKRIVYNQHLLYNLIPKAKEEDYIELGFKETISIAAIELANLLIDTFCSQGLSGLPDPRCKIAMEMPALAPASLFFLAWNFPGEEEIPFIYQTQSKELKRFLKNIVLFSKDIKSEPLHKNLQ